jgi:hypothetical protein
MLIISAGMQKSGSAYVYNIINDLLINTGYEDARKIKNKHHLERLMKGYNNNIKGMQLWKLLKLLMISFKYGDFVVKTHSGPTVLSNFFIKIGLIKIIYIYRDPRDVIVSAIDHGNKIISNGKNHSFAKIVKFEKAVEQVKVWINIYHKFKKNKNVLCIKYEDLSLKAEYTLGQICKHLSIKVSDKDMISIIMKYDKNNPKADMYGLHFNQAKIKRFKEELLPEQILFLDKELGTTITSMGYV